MMTFNDALEILLSQSLKLEVEEVSLFDACKKILAKDIFASNDLPSFSNSAMDGYAVAKIDSDYLLQDGGIFAGDTHLEPIAPNHCIKIMTGAMIPPNTIAVIPFEHTKLEGNKVIPTHPIKEGQNIKFCGEDYKKGQKLLDKGDRLAYDSLSLLASQGISTLEVYKQPKIAIYASGDELKEPWEVAESHQIYNTNAISHYAILQENGFSSTYLGILPDDETILNEKIREFTDYDIIITSGGASVGEADLFEKVLQNNQAKILFHGINLKPGKPMLCAKLKNTLVISLPGNPLSGSVNLITLVLGALHKLSGTSAYFLQSIQALHNGEMNFKNGRANIVLGDFDGKFFTPFQKGKYGSGSLKPLHSCNSLAIFDEKKLNVANNELIWIIQIQPHFGKNQKQILNSLR